MSNIFHLHCEARELDPKSSRLLDSRLAGGLTVSGDTLSRLLTLVRFRGPCNL